MEKNKLVYVVGTNFFYDIRIFEDFDKAYEWFVRCVRNEIKHCTHFTDEQRKQTYHDFEYYCSCFKKQNHDIFTGTASYEVENVFKKKVTYYFSTEILERQVNYGKR